MVVGGSNGDDGDVALGQNGHVSPCPWDPTDFRTFKNVFIFILDDFSYLLYSTPQGGNFHTKTPLNQEQNHRWVPGSGKMNSVKVK